MIIKCKHGVSMANCKLCKPIKFEDDLWGWKEKAAELGMTTHTSASTGWGIHTALKDDKECGCYEESFNGRSYGYLAGV